ncbi:MAG TPA: hypothetical protein ENG33_03310 [Chloroflexi bacterium]|nr:hypothetical protein [Chloroflexota bacterium]
MELAERKSIVNIEGLVEDLAPEDQAIFKRIFHVTSTVGELVPPPSMHPWIEKHFGSVEAVLKQRIIKITNLVTMEGALFNELRASRPMEAKDARDLEEAINAQKGGPFCRPLEGTPADVFGRVRGRHCITASNIAKYDGFHGLVIFENHNPLVFDVEEVKDYFDTALGWARAAHQMDPEARYFFLMWNCLWKSGASIIHGHIQLTLSKGMHYAKVEALRRAALAYRKEYGSDYFADLYRIHEALGLGWRDGNVRGMAYLTPIKEKEIILIASGMDDNLKEAVYRVLSRLTKELGVQSFNLALYMPPLAEAPEDWEGFPHLIRIVDRGEPFNRTADFGAMELYAASVIASDPFQVAAALR